MTIKKIILWLSIMMMIVYRVNFKMTILYVNLYKIEFEMNLIRHNAIINFLEIIKYNLEKDIMKQNWRFKVVNYPSMNMWRKATFRLIYFRTFLHINRAFIEIWKAVIHSSLKYCLKQALVELLTQNIKLFELTTLKKKETKENILH